jgi:APA family basic amino acid/polyamine antiporter
MAEELKSPQRTVPLGLIVGVGLVIVLFLGVNVAYLSVLSVPELARSDHPAAALMQSTAGSWGRSAISALVMCSTFGGINAHLLTASRTYFAMARDGVLFAPLAEVHPRFRTPANAICLHAGWALVLLFGCSFIQWAFRLGTDLPTLFSLLTSVVVFGAAIFETTAIAAVYVLRRRDPDRPRPYRVPGYPWVPGLAILSYLALLASTLAQKPVQSGVGVLLIAAGIPVLRALARRPAVPVDVD